MNLTRMIDKVYIYAYIYNLAVFIQMTIISQVVVEWRRNNNNVTILLVLLVVSSTILLGGEQES